MHGERELELWRKIIAKRRSDGEKLNVDVLAEIIAEASKAHPNPEAIVGDLTLPEKLERLLRDHLAVCPNETVPASQRRNSWIAIQKLLRKIDDNAPRPNVVAAAGTAETGDEAKCDATTERGASRYSGVNEAIPLLERKDPRKQKGFFRQDGSDVSTAQASAEASTSTAGLLIAQPMNDSQLYQSSRQPIRPPERYRHDVWGSGAPTTNGGRAAARTASANDASGVLTFSRPLPSSSEQQHHESEAYQGYLQMAYPSERLHNAGQESIGASLHTRPSQSIGAEAYQAQHFFEQIYSSGKLRCRLCNILITGSKQKSVAGHVNGRQHQANLRAWLSTGNVHRKNSGSERSTIHPSHLSKPPAILASQLLPPVGASLAAPLHHVEEGATSNYLTNDVHDDNVRRARDINVGNDSYQSSNDRRKDWYIQLLNHQPIQSKPRNGSVAISNNNCDTISDGNADLSTKANGLAFQPLSLNTDESKNDAPDSNTANGIGERWIIPKVVPAAVSNRGSILNQKGAHAAIPVNQRPAAASSAVAVTANGGAAAAIRRPVQTICPLAAKGFGQFSTEETTSVLSSRSLLEPSERFTIVAAADRIPTIAGAVRDRGSTRVTFKMATIDAPLAKTLMARLQEWDPFWVNLALVRIGVTSTVDHTYPVTDLIKTAAAITELDLSCLKAHSSQLRWGKERSNKLWTQKEDALILRMLPLNVDAAYGKKRADCHLWPKGTFLEINGKPVDLNQRKQQAHDHTEWKCMSKELNVTAHIANPKQKTRIQMVCLDDQPYFYCLGMFQYRSVDDVFASVMNPASLETIKIISIEESRKKAMDFAARQMTVGLDSDTDNADKDDAGRFIFSLTCPISKTIMTTPVRGKQCKHWQVCPKDRYR